MCMSFDLSYVGKADKYWGRENCENLTRVEPIRMHWVRGHE